MNSKRTVKAGAALLGTCLMLFLTAHSAAAGEVTATGREPGIYGVDLVVEVTAEPDRIISVEVISQQETTGIGSKAVESLPGEIVEKQSLLVDDISGATVTSQAIKKAVREALESAGLDPSVYDGTKASSETKERSFGERLNSILRERSEKIRRFFPEP